MNKLSVAVDRVLQAQHRSGKPLGIIVAGHNGSGKSTMWRQHLSDRLQIPLINADRIMLSILPEIGRSGFLPPWAAAMRDSDESWLRLSRNGVDSFVAQAMAERVPFAFETVFSDWALRDDGTIRSKIERIHELQAAGYFVLLFFVGLSNATLSAARVLTRVATGGHAVPGDKIVSRFPRTQRAIREALPVADAAILVDNSLDERHAFSVCRIQLREEEVFDTRGDGVEPAIAEWLDIVAPRTS